MQASPFSSHPETPSPHSPHKVSRISLSRYYFNKCGFYLPFLITIGLISFVIFMYLYTYLRPFVLHTTPHSSIFFTEFHSPRSYLLLAILAWMIFWLLVSLYCAVFTPPGSVPPNAENQEFQEQNDLFSQANFRDTPITQASMRNSDNKQITLDSEDFPLPDCDLNSKRNNFYTLQGICRSPVKLSTNAIQESRTFEVEKSEMTICEQDSKEEEEEELKQEKGESEKLLTQNLIHFRTIEKDKEGYNRFCKFCLHSKVSQILYLSQPDRTHHCKVCGTCVLKMDHHCPWILNCVGYYNYKYFLLLLFYSGNACLFIALTYWEAVSLAMQESHFLELYLICMAYLLSLTLAFVLNAFLAFHVLCLLFPNFTTIEFCEKRKDPDSIFFLRSPFNRGVYKNCQDVLGPSICCWFFPCPSKCLLFLLLILLSSLFLILSLGGRKKAKDGLEFEQSEEFKHDIN